MKARPAVVLLVVVALAGFWVIRTKTTAHGYPSRGAVDASRLLRLTLLGHDVGQGQGIAIDRAGRIYVTGYGSAMGFPAGHYVSARAQSHSGGNGITDFIALLNAKGKVLRYLHLLPFRDWPSDIAVDRTGNIYVTGSTDSTHFPTEHAFQAHLDKSCGCTDAFVAKLDPSGRLIYSTYLGGNRQDGGTGIAVDWRGDAYVTGYTDSSTFPTRHPIQAHYGGPDPSTLLNAEGWPAGDAFVAKFSPEGKLLFSTYLGGRDNDYARGIAVDEQGNVLVTGRTVSANFPTLHPLQKHNPGGPEGVDAFVTKLDSGGRLVYSTYLGGSGVDTASRVAMDGSGNAYITGSTNSSDFPTKNALQASYLGGTCSDHDGMSHPCTNAFVTKLDSRGRLVYSTYLGGEHQDVGSGIAVDQHGSAYVIGSTDSSNFPSVNPVQTSPSKRRFCGCTSIFVANLTPTGRDLAFSTYLGGSGTDTGLGIAADREGHAFITGQTSLRVPTGPYDNWRAFVAEIATATHSRQK
jgi:hypothetical protein